METDMMKSAEDHMDMISMMLQMEKLPADHQFSGPNYQDMASIEFSGGANLTAINGTPAPSIFQNPFLGNPIQEPMTPPLHHSLTTSRIKSTERNSMAAMREIIYRMAAMQPIHIDPESIKPPKRRNVKISKDPQSVAARRRRERISERIRILQRLVPGGTKMDTASMLDEAIHYVKFLKKQVQALEQAAGNRAMGVGFPATMMGNLNYSSLVQPSQMLGSMQMLR